MTGAEKYEVAKNKYQEIGVDTDAAIERLSKVPIALHCWQGDDVTGFDHKGPLTGGIQATGNYPGKAGNWKELMQDYDKAMSLMPGKKKLNLHASYAVFEDGEFVDRDKLEPKHFARWVEFAKERGLGIDFNPTFFSHEKVKDGRLPVRMKQPGNSGLNTEKHVSGLRNILQKRQEFPVS